MTREQISISRKNRDLLRIKLGIQGNNNLVLHHVNTELKHNNIEQYIQWNEEDVVILTRAEHNIIHSTGRHWTEEQKIKYHNSRTGIKMKPHSEEAKQKISEALKGRPSPLKGTTRSEETKAKIKAAKMLSNPVRGKHWKLVDGKRVYY